MRAATDADPFALVRVAENGLPVVADTLEVAG